MDATRRSTPLPARCRHTLPRQCHAGCPPQRGAASGTPACRPLHWKQAQAEEGHYACRTFELGLAHGGEPAALAALRAGPDNAAAAELLHLDRTSLC